MLWLSGFYRMAQGIQIGKVAKQTGLALTRFAFIRRSDW
jgi:hypothetical protein